jgi:hypothetical protein
MAKVITTETAEEWWNYEKQNANMKQALVTTRKWNYELRKIRNGTKKEELKKDKLWEIKERSKKDSRRPTAKGDGRRGHNDNRIEHSKRESNKGLEKV